jgi:hypothetical protein
MSVNVKMQSENHELMDWSNDSGWKILQNGTNYTIRYRIIDKLAQIIGESYGGLTISTSSGTHINLPSNLSPTNNIIGTGTAFSNNTFQFQITPTYMDLFMYGSSSSYWAFNVMHFVGGGVINRLLSLIQRRVVLA